MPDCIVLCDTNGGMLPDDVVSVFRSVKDVINAPLSATCIMMPDVQKPIPVWQSSKVLCRYRVR